MLNKVEVVFHNPALIETQILQAISYNGISGNPTAKGSEGLFRFITR